MTSVVTAPDTVVVATATRRSAAVTNVVAMFDSSQNNLLDQTNKNKTKHESESEREREREVASSV